MKLIGLISTAVLSLTIGAAVPVYAQEQHDQQEEKKDQPAEQKEKKPQAAKPAKQEEKAPQQHKNAKQEEKTAHQQDNNAKQQEKTAQQQDKNAKQEEKTAHQQQQPASHARPAEQAQHGGGGRIPDDRFKAHFGQEHRFRVTQANYSSRHFQYGGYSFGFVDPWPGNWLYTQDVYLIEIDGVYYLCNPMYPGVNIALSFTL
jgi:outer membrane biosynthesis protein TonB